MKLPQIEQTPPTTLTRTANNVPLGIALFVCTTLFFTGLDASAKYMSAELPTAQIVWMRFLSHVVILTIVVLILAPKRALQKPRRPGLQVLRSAVMAMTTVLNFMALKTMQLAETNAIFFTAPMFIAILAGPLLGEWAGPRRWAAIMIGFVGVLIITRPGTGNVGLPALYVLAAAFIYGIYAILTRKLSGADDPIITFLMTPVAGVFIFAPGALAVWEAPPDMLHWVLLFTIGVFGGIGHGLLILATQNAPAPVLAPFIYIQLVWMAAAGYLIFGDVPDTMTFIGAAIVVVSGVYLWFRERKIAASDK